MNTPRICFLKAMRKVLEDMPESVRGIQKERCLAGERGEGGEERWVTDLA